MKFQDSAERRFLTILHCDLVKSTQLVDRLDPEDFLLLIETFLDIANSVVSHHQGTLARFTGDGFEAYFGFPAITETPAVDAVLCAFEMQAELARRKMPVPERLECRIGIATGLAVIGTPQTLALGRQLAAFGSVTHLAARLQSVAEPGQVYVDEETRQLAARHCTFVDAGSKELKGFDPSTSVFKAVTGVAPNSRFDSSSVKISPFAGRQHVLDVLNDRWRVVLESKEGQGVYLSGEAGIGKSRAIYEFESEIKSTGVDILRFQCSRQHSSTPLHPWLYNIQQQAKFHPSDDNSQKRAKLDEVLLQNFEMSAELRNMCANLLGIFESDDATPVAAATVGAAPNQLLSQLEKVLLDTVRHESRKAPVVIIVEDTQWIDATSLSGLEALLELCMTEQILICITSRLGIQDFCAFPHITSLSVSKLSSSEVSAMIVQLAKSRELEFPDSLIDEIIQKSDGNPLFVEEISLMFADKPELWQSEAGKPQRYAPGNVPVSLQASLLSRIDRIDKGKDIAQIASVIGQNVDDDLIAQISDIPAADIQAGLDALVSSNILYSVTHGKNVMYEYRHMLIKEAIYSSLLKDKKESLHAAIAGCFLSQWQSDASLRPELIAQHFDLASDWRGAFGLWVLAGERALRNGATTEAVSLLAEAHKYESNVDGSSELDHQLQRMHMAYGFALNASRGVVSDPYGHFLAAAQIGEKLDDLTLTINALDWQFGVDFNAGRLDRAKLTADKLRRSGIEQNSSLAYIVGAQALGMVNFMLGLFEQSCSVFHEVLEKEKTYLSGLHCYPSMTLSYLAWALYFQGDSDKAATTAKRAIESANSESSHALATALSNCCYVYQCIGDKDSVDYYSRKLVDHCEKFGERMYLCRGQIVRHWLHVKNDQDSAAIINIEDNIALLLEAKEEIELTYLLGLLADAQIHTGQLTQAYATLQRAFGFANKNQENFYLDELNRLSLLCTGANNDQDADNRTFH